MPLLEDETAARAYVAARCEPQSSITLETFADLLASENEKQNLIAASTLPILWRRHIADSAQLLEFLPDFSRGTWIDLGSGAGFPGLVIAAMRPQFHVKLVESRKLRIDWLRACVMQLGLGNCEVLGSRVEAAEAFSAAVISARAFAPLKKTIELGRRFSTSDTTWLLPKGRSAAQEVKELPKKLRGMFHVEQSISDADAGIIVGRITEKAGR